MKNDPIFAAMRAQLAPSEGAQAALLERLAAEKTRKKEEKPMIKHWKALTLVACAAFSLCIYPIYNLFVPQGQALHSYVLTDGSDPAVKMEYRQQTGALDGGDRDQLMLPEEVVEAMEGAGFSTADIEAYQALGYEMTWAKWWKYVGSAETHDLESLKTFSEQELAPNTGDLPGGAYIGDAPAQPAADAYQLLMAHFGDILPDWYGGAYVDGGALMVLLVEGKDPADKSLELEVLEAVGHVPVAFTDVKYSLTELQKMNGELLDLLDGSGTRASWGIYEDQNRIVLDVPEPLSDDLLVAIAKIDPEDDAILIRVVEGTALTDLVKGPPAVEPIGEPAAPGGVTEPQEKRPAVVQDLPGEKETPANYDILPLELE